jgi:hypothetical protein
MTTNEKRLFSLQVPPVVLGQSMPEDSRVKDTT